MATLKIELPDDVKSLAETRAAEAGCADVGEYLAELVRGEAAGAPPAQTVNSDEELESLLLQRLDGEAVDMDDAAFRRMRQRLQARLDTDAGSEP